MSKKISLKDLRAECEAYWLKSKQKLTIINRLQKYKDKMEEKESNEVSKDSYII